MSLSLPTNHTLDVNAKTAKHWIIVGAGGNGGYLLPNLIRLIALQNRFLKIERRPEHIITIIDADTVEDKNLTRQNFIQSDVGKNKAEVMANRYGGAFGVEVSYIPEYLDSPKMLKKIVTQGKMKPVFIGAVDNNKTRAIIHETFKTINGAFWIDAGNEEWGGQVSVGYNALTADNLPEKGLGNFSIPSVADIFPEILEATDKLPHEQSCAERAVSNPQNIQTNQTAANLMMGFCNTILTAKSEEGEGLKSHLVMFNVKTQSFTTKLNLKENLIPAPVQEVKEEAVAEVEVKKEVKKRAPRKKKEPVEAATE